MSGERGQLGLRLADKYVGIPTLALAGLLRRKRKPPSPEKVRTIGIMVLAAIGDTVLASALIAPLRSHFPQARILAITTKTNRTAAELAAGFDDIVTIPVARPWNAIRILRAQRLDVVIDCGQWARLNAVLAWCSGVKFTVGFSTRSQWRHFGFDRAVQHSAARHELENFLALIAPLGAKPLGRPALKVPDGPSKLPGDRRWVAFHPWPAGVRSHLREWPRERWVELGRQLTARGYNIVITGGPADSVAATALADAIGSGFALSVAGRSSLRDTMVVLRDVDAVVSVNTGLMHMAAALDKPMIALHGPTNPLRWGPLSERAVVLGPGPEQGGGYLNLGNEYPPDPPDCMGQISVAEVSDALWRLLVEA